MRRGVHRSWVWFALAASLLVSCGRHETGLERVRRTGVLRWGADMQGGEPYVFEDAEHPGRVVGFEVELADAIARELGVRAELVQQDWSNLVPALERGTFDVAMNGLEVTPARAGTVGFTRPYFIFDAQLVVRRGDDRMHGLDDLEGMRVGTLANSLCWDLLQPTGANAIPYEGEPYADLSDGRLDAVLLDDIIASRYGLVRPDLVLAATVGQGYYSIATKPSDEDLRDAIDEALGRIAASGELRQILARWDIDSEAQAPLASWTQADTEAMLRSRSHASFELGHVWLFLEGAGVTVVVSTLAMLFAVLLGVGLALTRQYGPRFAGRLVTLYVELFRGTPVLLQLYVLYFGVMATLRQWTGFESGVSYDAFFAAVVGLGLNYAAYEAEIFRGGLNSVPAGQLEAAHALGMSTRLAVRRIIVPQAGRIALPGMTNDFISLLKDSSLVSVITVVELTKRMTITAVDVRSWLLPGLLCAALYLLMSYPLARLSLRLEKKLEGGK
ncbi:MAG: ABC transporter permease subunit [Myxococcales bacterium]|nr:ABC transporter permease subunit [Myxococcales bacterium]